MLAHHPPPYDPASPLVRLNRIPVDCHIKELPLLPPLRNAIECVPNHLKLKYVPQPVLAAMTGLGLGWGLAGLGWVRWAGLGGCAALDWALGLATLG